MGVRRGPLRRPASGGPSPAGPVGTSLSARAFDSARLKGGQPGLCPGPLGRVSQCTSGPFPSFICRVSGNDSAGRPAARPLGPWPSQRSSGTYPSSNVRAKGAFGRGPHAARQRGPRPRWPYGHPLFPREKCHAKVLVTVRAASRTARQRGPQPRWPYGHLLSPRESSVLGPSRAGTPASLGPLQASGRPWRPASARRGTQPLLHFVASAVKSWAPGPGRAVRQAGRLGRVPRPPFVRAKAGVPVRALGPEA